MPYLVRAFPLIRPIAEVREFIAELRARRDETSAFYRQYGVTHESAYLQEMPHGNMLIVVTLIDDQKAAAPRYQAASQAFDAWFKQQILHFSGVDPNKNPLGPPTTEEFSWSADESNA